MGRDELRSCGRKSTAPKSYFTAANEPKISFGIIYNACGVIKRFATIRKSCSGKVSRQKLKLTDRNVRLFRQYLSKNRHLANADKLKWASQSFKKTISEAPVRWYIKRCGYTFYKLRSKQFLIAANIRWWVAWAKSHLTRNLSLWERVFWANECIFKVSHGNVGQKVFRNKNKANDPFCHNRVVSHSSSVEVWGCIIANGDGNLHFCRDSINAQDYKIILNMILRSTWILHECVQQLFGRKRYLFQ